MKIKKKFDHLNYYIKHQISPVGQDLSSKKTHFQRREALYKSLGILKNNLTNMEVLEVGPAEGHNAAYIGSCKPKILHLIEPNPNANKNIKKIFKKLNVDTKNIMIYKKKLEKFKINKKYDLVICEAWLGDNIKERKLMKKLSRFVKKNGILITTTSSPIGFISNIIRRFVAQEITKGFKSYKIKTNYLVNFFKSHLKTMKNMSCPYDHWVQDCLLGDGFLNMHPEPKTLFKDVGNKFNFFNSYPKLYNEWMWYKDLIGKNFDLRKAFLKNYFKSAHNFIDYKLNSSEKKNKVNKKLSFYAKDLMNLLIKFESKKSIKNYNFFLVKLKIIIKFLKQNNLKILGYEETYNNLKKKSFLKIKNSNYFKYNFGRELLYISLIKDL